MLAYAGVKRMGYEDLIKHFFPETSFIPPVGQGCIAIEASSAILPEKKATIRKSINNAESEACLLAERAFLRKLEGGCSIPAFGLATLSGDELTLNGGLASLDGSTILKGKQTGSLKDGVQMGEALGEYILANGGREILAEIKMFQEK